ncbi:MAG: hypothetical protein ACQET5_02705 [Halobacteriota archaeon]|uniref:hypothetical protein n=1 Tax=Natronomonas sp. TaxID=2184060 RepID=UPI003975F9EC
MIEGPLTRRCLLGWGGDCRGRARDRLFGSRWRGGNPTDDEDAESDEPDPDLRVGERYLSSAFPIEFVDPEFDARTRFADDTRITYVHWHSVETPSGTSHRSNSTPASP